MVLGSPRSWSTFSTRLAGHRNRACLALCPTPSCPGRRGSHLPSPSLTLWQFAGHKAGACSEQLHWNGPQNFQDEKRWALDHIHLNSINASPQMGTESAILRPGAETGSQLRFYRGTQLELSSTQPRVTHTQNPICQSILGW